MIELAVVDVVVDFSEQFISAVRTGAPVRVHLDALPQMTPIDAAVTRIVPYGQRQGRTYPLKIDVTNSMDEGQQPILKAGTLVHVAIPLGAPQDALVVPKDALVLGGPSRTVLRVVPSSQSPSQLTVAEVPVRTGIAAGSQIEVFGELQPGDRVVVRGNERLRSGMPVQIVQQ